MAEAEKAPELGAELEAQEANYVLKKGVRYSYIRGGARVDVVGDGKGTVPMSPAQAAAFRDKLVSDEATDATVFETVDAETAENTGEPSNGASSGASAASSGEPKEAAKSAKK